MVGHAMLRLARFCFSLRDRSSGGTLVQEFLVLIISRLTALIAGLLGASGVAAAALAAHGGYGENLRIASEFALIHATLAIALLRAPGRTSQIAATVVLLGALVFCGDLALRALAGHALAPMAAPTGGLILITGWALAGIALFLNVKRL
ncbi:MAG: hypothetical protein JWO64_2453 [Hyphomicrobiales bacterium]|jgi:uncharacterized membrane protein YgdD (TMEM256/DUF423 family)|nr:hypothetical protein [Hyphomicrobiales bacterium]